MNFRIEPLKPEYLDRLWELELACFPGHPWSKQAFSDELDNPLAVYFLAFCGDKLCGYAGLWRIIDEGHITNVGVHPDFRRQGLGSLLIGQMVSYMNEKKLVWLTLEVRAGNLPARTLYEKSGFSECGLRKKYYEDGEDAVLYRLQRKAG